MEKQLSFQNSLEIVATVIAMAALLGVFQTFVIGKHFIIPTMLLFLCVLFGNLARYGFQGRVWAKQTLFWVFFLIAWHIFFALFWAKKYREVLGDSFEYVFGGIVVVLVFLLFNYARKNGIFHPAGGHSS
ncbi:MAG: hypothetical protein GXP15_03295 [Gammaproteobacteria bacterium]|nr:hypothetical protein [Gammaproteobacteria bacterium]